VDAPEAHVRNSPPRVALEPACGRRGPPRRQPHRMRRRGAPSCALRRRAWSAP
jgi:hypothetical protein